MAWDEIVTRDFNNQTHTFTEPGGGHEVEVGVSFNSNRNADGVFFQFKVDDYEVEVDFALSLEDAALLGCRIQQVIEQAEAREAG